MTMEQVLPYIRADPRPRTHLPVALPLAFPSPAHQLNLITVLHLVYDVLCEPAHTAYFLSANATPSDTALRGCMSLYLASDQDWSAANFLGAKGMRTLVGASVAEHFGIRTMVEKPHESMPGIVVGEKDEAGQRLVASLEDMFRDVAQRLDGHFDCVGSAVRYIAEEAQQTGEGAGAFARRFCGLAVQFLPSLADAYITTDSTYLPSGPLRLLQDLSWPSLSLGFSLPAFDELNNVSPLPLCLPPLIALGVFDGGDSFNFPKGGEEVMRGILDPSKGSGKGDSRRIPTIVTVPHVQLLQLQKSSVGICADLLRQLETKVSAVDILRYLEDLQARMDAAGVGFRLVPT